MAASQLPHWHVEGALVREETTLGPGNAGLITQWIIPYTIDDGPAKGTTHEVRVTTRDFTAEGVKQAITEALNSVHTVASLNSRHA